MPEEIELETTDLQEAIDEIHKEQDEREKQERASSWTKFISLSTAILAVFAAVGALQAGSLVNEAMISQLKASDTWNEYQASRQKGHLYTLQTNAILDAENPTPPRREIEVHGKWTPKSPKERVKEYEGQVKKEEDKGTDLMAKAKHLEEQSHRLMEKHEMFASSVAFIQVAIALGAVSALTKIKPVWFISMAIGAAGVTAFTLGMLNR